MRVKPSLRWGTSRHCNQLGAALASWVLVWQAGRHGKLGAGVAIAVQHGLLASQHPVPRTCPRPLLTSPGVLCAICPPGL